MSLKIETLCQDFEDRFRKSPVWGASAPGRVNLIGEHIDYNGGWVLPAAINRETMLLAAPSSNHRFCIQSLSYDTPFEWIDGDLPEGPVTPSWANYFLGAIDQMRNRGFSLPPIEVLIGSDLPTAAGLSSSAAFLVGTFTLFESILNTVIPARDKALWSQAAEHAERLRIRSGIMDQFISANAIEGHALQLNCGTLEFTPVPLDASRISILIVHSTVARELIVSAYNQRRLECETALNHLNQISGRQEIYLVGYSPDELGTWGERLEPTHLKRARHVITEQDRVERFVAAVSNHRVEEVGRLLTASHRSLAEDYEVSCYELDLIQEVASGLTGVYGCRMTGAGFGGCAVALLHPDHSEGVAEKIADEFEQRTHRRPWTLVTPAHAGARILEMNP